MKAEILSSFILAFLLRSNDLFGRLTAKDTTYQLNQPD
jgi:hypothetical protein